MNVTEIWIAQMPGLIVNFIAFILTLFIKEDLRRLKGDINLKNEETQDIKSEIETGSLNLGEKNQQILEK